MNGSNDYFLLRFPLHSASGRLKHPLGYLQVKDTENGIRYFITDSQPEDLYSEPVSTDQHFQKGESMQAEQSYILDFAKIGYLAFGDPYRLIHRVELDSGAPPDVWLVLENPSGYILKTIPNEATTDALFGFEFFAPVRFQKRSGIPYLERVT